MGVAVDEKPLEKAVAKPTSAFLTLFRTLKHLVEPPLELDGSLEIDKSLLENCKPHHRKAVEMAITDLYGRRHEALIRLPAPMEKALCDKVLNDKRDLRLFLTFLQITLWLLLSSAFQLLVLPAHDKRGLWFMVIHLPITWIIFGQRFILAMHYAAHRSLFHSRWGALGTLFNHFPMLVLCNFWGMPCGAYYLQHCVMHHQANNLFPHDISSTMPYDRSSPLQWVHYACNFMLHTLVYLPFYALRKGRLGLAAGSVLTTSLYFVAFPAMYAYHPVAFVSFFGVPLFMAPFALMLGNFSQHIFVDPRDPKSNYGLATNHLNAPFNMLTFNDGYHITHHVNSRIHWTEMPLHFIEHIDKYEEGDAIVLHGVNFEEVSFAVWGGNLPDLADKIVQLREVKRTKAELVEMLQERLKPIRNQQIGRPQRSAFVANQAMWIAWWFAGFPGSSAVVLFIPLFSAISFFM